MPVRQNVHDFIRDLSRYLSAGNGDNLSQRWLDNAEKNDKLIKY
jgi:hypothetical protein